MSNDVNKMELKQLRNEVQMLRDELAIMKRKYEDIIYNLDDDNFSSRFVKEKGDMKTAIEVTAEGIKTKVSNEEFESAMSQTAERIHSAVSKNIDMDKVINATSTDEFIDKSKIYSLDDELYYYNSISQKWSKVKDDESVQSIFEQTSDGFKLTGDVKVDGSCILTESLTFNSSDKPLEIEYSANGKTDWHSTFNSNRDEFMRIKIGSQWSDAMKVVGTDGGNGSDAEVTFQKVNAVLGHLYKTADNKVPTEINGSYIYSPSVLGGSFYGSVFYAGSGNGFSQMDEHGFSLYATENAPKVGIGYKVSDWDYPYITLGQGAGWTGNGSGIVLKLGSGVWIGDSSVLEACGNYPGGFDFVTNAGANATGLFIDFEGDTIYKYIKGVPTEISTSSGGSGTAIAVFG